MYPIWLEMFMPPYIFITILSYLIVLLVLLFIFKEKNIKKILFKSIVSITITSTFSSIILILLSLISNNLKDLIFYNHSTLYIIISLIIMIISGLANYFIHKKYILKDNKILCIIISLIFIPYLILLPKNTLELNDYKNTYIGDNSKVSSIIDLLDINKTSISLQTTNEPYVLNINLSDETSSVNLYQILEKDASIMFNLITNVSLINYNYKEKTYSFEFDKLNSIYGDLRGMEIKEIDKRYEEFNSDYIYMGHIDGYDIFDESITCEANEEFVKEEKVKYYITCSSLDDIYLYKDNQKYKLKDKLSELSIDDLLKTNLNIYSK